LKLCLKHGVYNTMRYKRVSNLQVPAMLSARLRINSIARHLHYSRRNNSSSTRSSNGQSSIRSLQAAFKDPTSPFYIAPGSQGPSSPDELPVSSIVANVSLPDQSVAELARKKLIDLGCDPTSFWEQQIEWGSHDAFQHVNNVHYVRFFESARIKWILSIGHELGGPAKAESMLKGKGVGFIVKYIDVNYKRPVTYPDTLLIGHKPSISSSQTEFNLHATAYSYAQSAIVAESKCVTVWYDYDTLRKCDPGEEAWTVVKGRIRD